ncbi:hypothetical protein DESC_120037 [Desulfosarcina cetonica]|nr:hypothetical protein DESC_120037 [Desulfosarcina cetonica]
MAATHKIKVDGFVTSPISALRVSFVVTVTALGQGNRRGHVGEQGLDFPKGVPHFGDTMATGQIVGRCIREPYDAVGIFPNQRFEGQIDPHGTAALDQGGVHGG